jgi:hypothetical protein
MSRVVVEQRTPEGAWTPHLGPTRARIELDFSDAERVLEMLRWGNPSREFRAVRMVTG